MFLYDDNFSLHADTCSLYEDSSLCDGLKNSEASPRDRNTLELRTCGCL